MMKLTASNIVSAIARLPRNRAYEYPNKKTKTKITIDSVTMPEGPIVIRRWGTKTARKPSEAPPQSLSNEMIWRVANAISEGQPVNLDRALAGSYNTRSALEALMLHTEEFYLAYPGRVEILNSTQSIKKGHKHILWAPNDPHEQGLIAHKKSDVVISEISHQNVYDDISFDNELNTKIDIVASRRHAQIQIALIEIGRHLKFRTWVAQNDQGIVYKNKKLISLDSVVPVLSDEKLLQSFGDAAQAGKLIDCIWFRNGNAMPAVIEIEHSTGVTSGLTRMKNFKDKLPAYSDVRWVIAAPDEIRDKVLREASKEQFRDMNTQFFPYSAIEELYSLCSRRTITGVNDGFLDCFMESATC